MRKVLRNTKISASKIYSQFCSRDAITLPEFKKLIVHLLGKIADFEVGSIFNELDKYKIGSIPKDKFLDWFGQDEPKGSQLSDSKAKGQTSTSPPRRGHSNTARKV